MRRKNLAIYLIFPSFIFLFIFTIFPILQSIYMSFFIEKIGMVEPVFNGLGNYKDLMKDEVFLKVIKNNIIFTLTTVPISMFLALMFAIFLNSKLKGIGFLRTCFFYPTLIPMIAVANIWLFMYTPEFGILNKLLNLLGIKGLNWLGDESIVMLSMIVMNIWKEAGYLMIFYLAGLQNIPSHLYESARIDGANRLQMFRDITIPMLGPTSLFVFIISTTNSFKMVDHLEIMTQGGPNNSSNLLLYYIYEVAFKYWDSGRAATLTVVMLMIMLSIAIFRFFKTDKNIHYS